MWFIMCDDLYHIYKFVKFINCDPSWQKLVIWSGLDMAYIACHMSCCFSVGNTCSYTCPAPDLDQTFDNAGSTLVCCDLQGVSY